MKKLCALTLMAVLLLNGINTLAMEVGGVDTDAGFGAIIRPGEELEQTTVAETETETETVTEAISEATTAEITTVEEATTETTTVKKSSGGGGGGGSSSGISKKDDEAETETEAETEIITEAETEVTTSKVEAVADNIPQFIDIDNHWAKDYVNKAVGLGLFSGMSATEFGPDISVTRGMAITVLGRMSGEDVSGMVSEFSDVDNSKYYAPYIAWASKAGIASGVGENRFEPEKPITRQEMAVFIGKFLEARGENLAKIDSEVFADDAEFALWAKDYIYYMRSAGIINGRTDNRFDARATATRAEFATIICNLNK